MFTKGIDTTQQHVAELLKLTKDSFVAKGM